MRGIDDAVKVVQLGYYIAENIEKKTPTSK